MWYTIFFCATSDKGTLPEFRKLNGKLSTSQHFLVVTGNRVVIYLMLNFAPLVYMQGEETVAFRRSWKTHAYSRSVVS
jgi:hypothetical protein